MKRIDALITKELFGPWFFGVALFSALLMAGTYLGRIADYVVRGVPIATIAKLVALLLPAILVQTFAMSMLLAGLLAFGRLSSDSEIVALRATGASLMRIVWPVALLSTAVALLAFGFNELVVPKAAKTAQGMTSDIARSLDSQSVQPKSIPQYDKGHLVAMVIARDFNLSTRTLVGVVVIAYDKFGQPTYSVSAPRLVFHSKDDWRIEGGVTVVPWDGSDVLHLDTGVWPDQVPKVSLTPDDVLAPDVKSFEIYSMEEIQRQIDKAIADRTVSPKDIANFEYGYWNKISLPLAAIVFGILGATLGIRNHRTGTATGFALAVGIIFAYFTLANFMNVWALGGVFPPYIASFAPVAVGAIACAFVIKQRNG